jgi:hypothetical protein
LPDISGCPTSVIKMPHSGKRHGNSSGVSGGDNLVITL